MPGYRLLALFAHPDDEAFPVGGALAACASAGVAVRLITATRGEEGEIRQPGVATRETIGAVREKELGDSVEAPGLASHTLPNYRDSGMAGTEPTGVPKPRQRRPRSSSGAAGLRDQELPASGGAHLRPRTDCMATPTTSPSAATPPGPSTPPQTRRSTPSSMRED